MIARGVGWLVGRFGFFKAALCLAIAAGLACAALPELRHTLAAMLPASLMTGGQKPVPVTAGTRPAKGRQQKPALARGPASGTGGLY
jgi:hypothetical protein